MDWPSPLKNKGVFFCKREKEPLPEDISELLNYMCCGDIHPNPLGNISILHRIICLLSTIADQFCGTVEEVYSVILKFPDNLIKFPHCVSEGNA